MNKPEVLKHFNVNTYEDLLLLVYSRNITASAVDYLKLDRRDHMGKLLSKGRRVVEDAKNPVIVPGAGTVASHLVIVVHQCQVIISLVISRKGKGLPFTALLSNIARNLTARLKYYGIQI